MVRPRVKVLIDNTLPFALAHGGAQTQVELTRQALEHAGLEVEWLRWWDDRQRGDLIHLFAPADIGYLQLARQKGMPVVLTTLLTAECNFPPAQLRRKRWKVALMPKVPGFAGISGLMPWNSFHLCTMNVVGLAIEKRVLEDVYGVPPAKVCAVPLGTSEAYLRAAPSPRAGDHLICTGTITARKRTNDLARLALRSETPILFVGKGYRPDDPYFLEFQSLVDGRFVRHQPHVDGEPAMIELYRAARGFVIYSDVENWCLSAHEAAACGLPVLLRPLPWAQERFGAQARYFAGREPDPSADPAILREFFDQAPALPPPAINLPGWPEVGERLREVYAACLA